MTAGDFYARITPFDDFARVADPGVYADAPDDWWLLLTDVRGSTRAIESGRYKDVNALGASVIMAVHNLTGGRDLPFVFGGDGATVLVPPELVDAARQAGAVTARLAEQAFGLALRVGLVPVAHLHAAGQRLRVARFQVSPDVTLAMFEGGGMAHADKLVKDPAVGARYAVPPAATVDPAVFAGFECRWRPLQSRRGEMVALLVCALGADGAARRATYDRVLALLDRLAVADARPTHPDNARLGISPRTLDTEARVRTGLRPGLRRLGYLLRAWLQARLGAWLIRRGKRAGSFDGAAYVGQLVANTDFRKFDDALRMVLDLTVAQREALVAALAAERAAGALAYGVHSAPAALMTCLVPTYDRRHLHFVDGADGGYALAARQLKAQLGLSSPAHPADTPAA